MGLHCRAHFFLFAREIAAMSDRHLLVAHPDATVTADLKQRLVGLGFTVSAVAHTRDETMALVGSLRPCLILAEQSLCDGLGPQTPVLRITACADSRQAVSSSATAGEPWEYLELPCSDRELQLAT